MKPIEPGPIEKLISYLQFTKERSSKIARNESEYDDLRCFEDGRSKLADSILKDLASLPPLIPAPQWMPEGWVPSEPGFYYAGCWQEGRFELWAVEVYVPVSDDPSLVACFAMGMGPTNDIHGEEEFSDYRWCPLPAAPKMGE